MKTNKKIQCYWTEQNRFQSQKVHGRPFIKVYDAQLRSPEHSPSSYWWPPASLWLLAWRAFFQPSWGNIRKWLRMAISWSCPQPLTNVYWRIKVPNSSFFGRNNSGKYLRPSPKVPSGADSLIPEEITCSLIRTIPYYLLPFLALLSYSILIFPRIFLQKTQLYSNSYIWVDIWKKTVQIPLKQGLWIKTLGSKENDKLNFID